MYLDPKKIIYAICFLIIGLVVWWSTGLKNEATRRMIEEVETGAPGGKQAIDIVLNYGATLKESRRLMLAGEFAAASSTAYRPFSTFENLLNGRPSLELENGQTLESWFEEQKSSFSLAVREAYGQVLEALSEGDLSHYDARSFISQMPYPFKGDMDRQFRADLEAVRKARAESAADWVLVRAGASIGNAAPFEAIIHEELRRRWPADSPYKLVIGRPMSDAEERAAAKVYQIYVTGETVLYESEEEAFKNRGTGKLLTSLTLEWIDRSKNRNAIPLNWDELEPITVRVDVPDEFSFRFDNNRQIANFDDIEAEQRERVLAELKKAIRSWPQAKVLVGSN